MLHYFEIIIIKFSKQLSLNGVTTGLDLLWEVCCLKLLAIIADA